MSFNKNQKIVAVDGHAGSGKSSICKLAAKELNWNYFSTGILYRVSAAILLGPGTKKTPAEAAAFLCQNGKWNYSLSKIEFGEINLEVAIYEEENSLAASGIASDGKVRELLLGKQREIAENSDRGIIVDGRDIGTVVFPGAGLKFFMTASVDCRALRRVRQILGEHLPEDQLLQHPMFHELKKSITQRDKQDSERDLAPLCKAPDAILVDTSEMTKKSATKWMVGQIKDRFQF